MCSSDLLSPRADEWGDFCARTCAVLGVPFSVERVDLSRHRAHGREGAARVARYEAYARHEADVLVLAHHADDQAETVMLRLLRGAGPGGLSGMRSCRVEPGVSWKKLLRPLLGIPGGEIAAYAGERGINWVTDESNDDTQIGRAHV